MPFTLRDPATCEAVLVLAKRLNVSPEEAIRMAVEQDLAREIAARESKSKVETLSRDEK
jgi:hypothetical protein